MKLNVISVNLELVPVTMRLPLKFGAETIQSITCARVRMTLSDGTEQAEGLGETPISVAWGWPSSLPFFVREQKMLDFCKKLAEKWTGFTGEGHAMDLGYDFLEHHLFADPSELPHLARLICSSAFDIALHDAYGKMVKKPVYQTYNKDFMPHDLSFYYDGDPAFKGKYPQDFFASEIPQKLPVWHLVGGKDLLSSEELTGNEPNDGFPVTLRQWIERDGLKCLKIKLTGSDPVWDYQRMVNVGTIALEYGCEALSPDFNCLVKDPAYVNEIIDKLKAEYPPIYDLLLYVEQPFPYDLEENKIDVHSCSERKPLFMDESAHDWRLVDLGFQLGWTGVALKVCKTQTGALLSACRAKSHGMKLMVQDLTNPMYAMIPHVRLAQHVGTIKGVECNAPQFYPEASLPFEKNHPGLYERRNGIVDCSTLTGDGFGY